MYVFERQKVILKSIQRNFIIAAAKDADMAFDVMASGSNRAGQCSHDYDERQDCYKTLADYLEQIRSVLRQQLVDIMLLSASSLEWLGVDEALFSNSPITPAARASDTTDVWAVRKGNYPSYPSRHFRTATLDHIKYGKLKQTTHVPTPARISVFIRSRLPRSAAKQQAGAFPAG